MSERRIEISPRQEPAVIQTEAWLEAVEPSLPPGIFHLLSVLDFTAVEFAVFDPADHLAFANAAYRRAFGLAEDARPTFSDIIRAGAVTGHGVRIDCGDPEAFLAEVLPRRRVQPQRAFATDLCSGEWRWVQETLLPDGWMLCVLSDITPLKRIEQSLRAAHSDALVASRTDSLTGVANRRWIRELAEAELDVARARGTPLSAVLLDVDFFKSINDSAGHEGGDRVLVAFAREARLFFRRGDVIGRPGGDEFLVLMPLAGSRHSFSAVERFRERLALRAHGPGEMAFTFSAGVAELQPGETVDDLLRRADEALYEAKGSGRGRTAVHA